jgi:hypothetical protein
MSETTVGNIDQAAGVAVGEGAAAQHQTVTVNVAAPADSAKVPLTEQIRSTFIAILSLQQMFTEDRAERAQRQAAIDTQLDRLHRRMDRLELLVARYGYAVGMPGAAALLIAGYELGIRMGWW